MTSLSNYLKLFITIFAIFLVGCSNDTSHLPLNEQAIATDSRFSNDLDKDKYRHPLEVLNFIDLKPGMTVIDLLGGGGYYSELFNHIVGNNGKVYLQNNSLFLRFSEKEIIKRLKNNRLKNVIRLDGEFSNMKLPSKVDLIFIGLSFHDFYVKRDDPVITADRNQIYRQIKQALKPGGILVIIDHSAKSGTGITQTTRLHRIDEAWTKKDIQSEGFELIGELDSLRNSKDDDSLDIWKKKVFHKTDRFVHRYRKIPNQ